MKYSFIIYKIENKHFCVLLLWGSLESRKRIKKCFFNKKHSYLHKMTFCFEFLLIFIMISSIQKLIIQKCFNSVDSRMTLNFYHFCLFFSVFWRLLPFGVMITKSSHHMVNEHQNLGSLITSFWHTPFKRAKFGFQYKGC